MQSVETTTSSPNSTNAVFTAVTVKFRGYRIDNDMPVYGNGIVIVDKDYIAIPQTKDVTSKDYAIKLCKVHVGSESQFTGLYDRKGEEIYSNDILAPYGNLSLSPKMDECFAVEFNKGSYNIGNESDTDYYVVGNTYKNSELLKSGSNSR